MKTILAINLITLLQALLLIAVTAVTVGVFIANRVIRRRTRLHARETGFTNQMIQEALKNSKNNVLLWNPHEGRIDQLYGDMLPFDTINEKQWRQHVHPEDLDQALGYLHNLRSGKIQSADFYYRWNYEFDEAKPPRWGYFNNTSRAEYLPDHDKPVNIISTLTDESDIRNAQREEQEIAERFRLIFEQSIIGMSFYSPQGRLLDANKGMRDICHFDSDVDDAFFSNTSMFDLPPFNELVNRDRPEELWVCYQSIIPERNIHDYLEIHLHPIYDDLGNVICIEAVNCTGLIQ